MKLLATIGDVELRVCDDGMFVVRGGMFMDDMLRLGHENAIEFADAIKAEARRRVEHNQRVAERRKKRKVKLRKK